MPICSQERLLICDSLSEAKRALKVKFAHATTDRLRTLVTLGHCAGLHYSGHGDPNHLCMEDGRGAAHIVPIEQLRKLLSAGGVTSLKFVFVSACFSEAAAQAGCLVASRLLLAPAPPSPSLPRSFSLPPSMHPSIKSSPFRPSFPTSIPLSSSK